MDLQKFDSTLKSALENIEVPFDASTWASLESRLDALPAPDAVDKALRPSLERIETSYDAGTWSALSNRMDSNARVRRMRMSKLAEAAIFLLLLLNLKGFFGVMESVTNPAPAKKDLREPIAKSQPSKSKKQIPSPITSDQNTGLKEGQSIALQVVAYVQNLATVLTQGIENEDLRAEKNSPQPIADNTSVLDAANFYGQSGILKFSFGPTLPARPVSPVLFASSMISIPRIEISKASKPSRLYAASYASFDKNYLHQGNHSDKKTGYGGGFAVGYRKGKWGVEAGLQYSQKHYQPKQENLTYQNDLNGISTFHIDNVAAELVSVPVKVTRRIARISRTTAHAVAGVTTNFATSKSYGYKTQHYPPAPVNGLDPAPLAELPNAKGMLENGGLTYNAYATADLGLRVEQTLGKRYTAFVEPIFRQSLGGGLGPNSTRLSTFSIQAGVMASL